MVTTFASFETLAPGQRIEGPVFAVSRETIRAFCDASLDYNPLHLDDDYMQGSFGKTSFGGIIMHGMNNFGLMTRMLTDWAYAANAVHRRLETRWLAPVKPGDTITLQARALDKFIKKERLFVIHDNVFLNQHGDVICSGRGWTIRPQWRARQ